MIGLFIKLKKKKYTVSMKITINDTYSLLNYVLDKSRPGAEYIVKEGPICVTRGEFWSLGLQRDMDSTVSNGM